MDFEIVRGAALWAALALTAAPAAASTSLVGEVVDENGAPVPQAGVVLHPTQHPEHELRVRADAAGRFTAEALQAGPLLVSARKEGFYRSDDLPVALGPGENRVTVVLQHIREERQSIDVHASAPEIDMTQTSSARTVRNEEIVALPYPSSHSFRNALRLTPGATVQDRTGELHFNGAAANQVFWSLDGFNAGDPLTGLLKAPLNVEAVRSATLSSGRYSAEYGKGSAGAMAIETEMGGDRFRYTASNFVPGVEMKKGLRLGDWRPRAKLSGPIRKGRAWFAASLNAEYTPTVVEELPRGQDRSVVYGVSNLSRVQWNVTESNILRAGALLSGSNARHAGLSPLDPIETTPDTRSRQYFSHVKDQIYLAPGFFLEAGYAHNRTFGRETPLGSEPLLYTPAGRTGNWFVDASRWTTRNQWLASLLLPAFSRLGRHQIKAGIDLNGLDFRQDARRTGFERRGLEGELLRRVDFGGRGAFSQDNFEAAWYLEDSWKPAGNLLVELGLRRDWDRLVRTWSTSPRLSFAWSPNEEDFKISGGFAVVHDATPLATFTRGLDQFRLTETVDPASGDLRGPFATFFVADSQRYRAPRYRNWSFGVERRLPSDVFLRAGYLRRRGRRGFTFLNTSAEPAPELIDLANRYGAGEIDGVFALSNAREDLFDSVEITARKRFSGARMLAASYARSRSRSNAALDISVDSPSVVFDNVGRTPWDAPNRLLSWGYWAFNRKWAGAYMLEWRSGFPFSVEDEAGAIVGAVSSHSFPDFVELNLSVERSFTLLHRAWALRLSMINATDRRNPTVVNNTIGSPDFLRFSGGTSRAFVARVRWLGTR